MRVGDTVLALATSFSVDWAKANFGKHWRSARVEGTIARRQPPDFWVVEFDDGYSGQYRAKELKFKERPAPAGRPPGTHQAASEHNTH